MHAILLHCWVGTNFSWSQFALTSSLDLEHCRCNRIYVPWLNKGRRRTDFPRNIMGECIPSLTTNGENDINQHQVRHNASEGCYTVHIALQLTNLCSEIDVSLRRSVTQAKRLSRNAITWKETSIDQVMASPVTPSAGSFDSKITSPIKTKSKKSLSISTNIENESWYGGFGSPIDRCGSPESMYCTGKCRDDPCVGMSPTLSADVVRVLCRQPSFS